MNTDDNADIYDTESIACVWVEYKKNDDISARDRLIVHYSPLVKYVAGRVASGLPQSIDQGDLVAYGIFGLIDAINKFDTSRNIKFETYAIARIRGAIIDGRRSIDWVPRSVRTKARRVEKAYASLEHRLLRTPTDVEVAEEMRISKEELQQIFTQISFVGLVALDEVMGGGDGQSQTLGDTLPDKGEGPGSAFEGEEMKQILAAAINRLGEREKLVLSLYYYEGLTLVEIGKVLGVTESRVCQIHTKAVLQLRSRIKDDGRDPQPRALFEQGFGDGTASDVVHRITRQMHPESNLQTIDAITRLIVDGLDDPELDWYERGSANAQSRDLK